MTQPMPMCRHCRVKIRQYEAYMPFLLPKPDGQVKKITMHAGCIEKWNRLAVTKEYSDRFYRKVV